VTDPSVEAFVQQGMEEMTRIVQAAVISVAVAVPACTALVQGVALAQAQGLMPQGLDAATEALLATAERLRLCYTDLKQISDLVEQAQEERTSG